LKATQITEIITSSFQGEIGNPVLIRVNDLFKVKNMKVTLTNLMGEVIESGNAVLAPEHAAYAYIATVRIPDIAGITIKVEVTDRPGNLVTKSVTLP
jgi:hypothetical protein